MRKSFWHIYSWLSHKIYLLILKLPFGNKTVNILRKVAALLHRTAIPNPVIVKGNKLFWNPTNVGYAMDMSLNEYEYETTKLISKILKPGMAAIDVGANIGYYTLLFASVVGEKGKVYSFE